MGNSKVRREAVGKVLNSNSLAAYSTVRKGKIEVVKAMLANNVDVNTIVKFTGLSTSEIKELQN